MAFMQLDNYILLTIYSSHSLFQKCLPKVTCFHILILNYKVQLLDRPGALCILIHPLQSSSATFGSRQTTFSCFLISQGVPECIHPYWSRVQSLYIVPYSPYSRLHFSSSLDSFALPPIRPRALVASLLCTMLPNMLYRTLGCASTKEKL